MLKKQNKEQDMLFDNILGRLSKMSSEEDVIKDSLPENIRKYVSGIGESKDGKKKIVFITSSAFCTRAMFEKNKILKNLRENGFNSEIDFKVGYAE